MLFPQSEEHVDGGISPHTTCSPWIGWGPCPLPSLMLIQDSLLTYPAEILYAEGWFWVFMLLSVISTY